GYDPSHRNVVGFLGLRRGLEALQTFNPIPKVAPQLLHRLRPRKTPRHADDGNGRPLGADGARPAAGRAGGEGPWVIEIGCVLRNGGMVEAVDDRQLGPQLTFGGRYGTQREQRVAAEVEKVVFGPDLIQVEDVLPNLGQLLLCAG